MNNFEFREVLGEVFDGCNQIILLIMEPDEEDYLRRKPRNMDLHLEFIYAESFQPMLNEAFEEVNPIKTH